MNWNPPKPLPPALLHRGEYVIQTVTDPVTGLRMHVPSTWSPPSPLPSTLRQRIDCTQCGGPLERHELKCSWCKSDTGLIAKPTGAQFVAYVRALHEAVCAGVMSANEAREAVGLTTRSTGCR